MPMLLKVPPPHLPMLATIKNNKSGYALLEILLAFAVAAIIITGMVSLGVSTVRAVTVNRAYSEAGKIAQREVDRLKLLRDTTTDWTAFSTAAGECSVCYINATTNPFTVVKDGSKGSAGTGGNVTTYYFTTSNPVSGRINYTVIATWTVGSAPEKTYKIEGVFTNWKEI